MLVGVMKYSRVLQCKSIVSERRGFTALISAFHLPPFLLPPCTAISVEDVTDVDLGTNVSFTCNTNGDPPSPPLSFSWRAEDNVFEDPTNRFSGIDTTVLNITDVGVSDVKRHICTVEVGGRQIGSDDGALNVIGE